MAICIMGVYQCAMLDEYIKKMLFVRWIDNVLQQLVPDSNNYYTEYAGNYIITDIHSALWFSVRFFIKHQKRSVCCLICNVKKNLVFRSNCTKQLTLET